LNAGGNVVLLESYLATCPDDFRDLVASGDLECRGAMQHSELKYWGVYYLWLTKGVKS
jgi:hypothetical protein